MAKIEMGKQYQTRDGYAVELIAVDTTQVTDTGDTVVGVVTIEDEPVLWSWQSNGSWLTEDGCDHPADLIEVPQAVTRWVNVYIGYETQYEARHVRGLTAAAACIEVTYTEGEGL
jgi:hypothetical protein